jgi:phage-related protein (TIGR01555 family)
VLDRINNIFKKKEVKSKIDEPELRERKYQHDYHPRKRITMDEVMARNFPVSPTSPADNKNHESYGMDDAGPVMQTSIGNPILSDALLNWFGAQAFIGYQLCAIIMQNWLVDKACTIPAKDAIRNGFEITANDGEKIDLELLEEIKQYDCDYKLFDNCIEFSRMARVFGIRICMFKVDSDNPIEYYGNPFNIDGVKPGSYKGMSQIDPYWITPELDFSSSTDPSSINFYEPTWWRVQGMRIHRSHLVINRPYPVSDILKPSYMYGGIPLVQKIYERVYAAERTANEAPLLAMTKRAGILKLDTSQAIANQGGIEQRMQDWQFFRDNYGTKIIDTNETYEQVDTSLSDLDALINTQYQIVSAIAEIPVSKLMGITLKGFNTSGIYEESSYHESLKSIQSHECEPLIRRHHQLIIKSFVAPKQPFSTSITWNPLSLPTEEELASLNKMKAETAAIESQIGAIDSVDERNRLITDPLSGYNGLEEKESDELEEDVPENDIDEDESVEEEEGSNVD